MSSLQFTSELLDDLLFRAGELVLDSVSDFEAEALRMLNRAYRSVCNGGSDLDPSVREDWWFLRKPSPGVLTLMPSLSLTGSVTQNSTAITLSATQATSLVGYFVKSANHSDIFRVAAHTGGSAAVTLDGPYTGQTNAASPLHFCKLEYDLATDVIRLAGPMRTFRPSQFSVRNYEVRAMDLYAMEREYPLALWEPGTPDFFAMVGETKVRFNRFTSSASGLTRIEYDYIFRPAELTNSPTQEPVLPLERRSILVDYALALVLDSKDDNRSQGVLEFARRGLLSMQLDNRHRMSFQNPNAGRILARSDRHRTHPVRTDSGLIIG